MSTMILFPEFKQAAKHVALWLDCGRR